MSSIGQELKRERELRGISLEEISSSTKISLRLLEALEEDRLDVLPGKFFIKAIISTYAKFIGLEEHSVLNRYYETSLLEEQSQESKPKKRKALPVIPKKIKRIIYLSFMLIIFFLIFLCFIYLFFLKKETPPPPEEQKASTPFQDEKPVLPPATEPAAKSLPEEEKLSLEISFLEKTWLQVYADGELKVDGLKQPGEKVTIEALDEFLIHLGNAGGVLFTLNDKEGMPIGPSGVVIKNLRITSENYQQFLAQEKESKNNP